MTTDAFRPSRRGFLAGGAGLAAMTLAGCSMDGLRTISDPAPRFSQYYLDMYGPLPDERFPVPAIDLSKLDPTKASSHSQPAWLRAVMAFRVNRHSSP